jgi:hypothetical protein
VEWGATWVALKFRFLESTNERSMWIRHVYFSQNAPDDFNVYFCLRSSGLWFKDLNIRPETLKIVQERVGHTLEEIEIGKDFLSRT